jgi:5S rRNA maturation endonuclease (ribonuclease M5)
MNPHFENLKRHATRIEQFYVNHPNLIEDLMFKIGAERVVHVHGQYVKCTCPIHMGNKPEGFRVWYASGRAIWKCFTDDCGKGGLVQLLQRRYQSTFEQAVISLGRFAGIPVDGVMIDVPMATLQEEDLATWKRRQKIHDNASAGPNIFPEAMIEQSVPVLRQKEWHHALNFLIGPQSEKTAWGDSKKGFTIEVLDRWQVGLIPGKVWVWQELDQQTQELGSVGFFEARITIPWRTPKGELMGFAGRRFDGVALRKYKQLPGTKRAHTLYGLHWPEAIEMIGDTKEVILVEGFGDVWRAHMHGIYNVLAVGGTELAPEQIQILKMLGLRRLTIYYDGDAAGQNAAQAMGKQTSEFTKVFIAVPPIDCDPGDIEVKDDFCKPIIQANPYFPKEK